MLWWNTSQYSVICTQWFALHSIGVWRSHDPSPRPKRALQETFLKARKSVFSSYWWNLRWTNCFSSHYYAGGYFCKPAKCSYWGYLALWKLKSVDFLSQISAFFLLYRGLPQLLPTAWLQSARDCLGQSSARSWYHQPNSKAEIVWKWQVRTLCLWETEIVP